MVLGDVERDFAAMIRASLTRVASLRRSMAQPTILRECWSRTAQQYRVPSRVLCSVMSVNHRVFGVAALNCRLTRSSLVAALTKFRRPFRRAGSPLRPSAAMICRISFGLTTSPRS